MNKQEELLARVEIEALAIHYYFLVDRGRGVETAELFAEPCDFDLPGGGTATTRQEVRDFYAKRDNTKITRHVSASMDIQFPSSDRAVSTRTITYFAGDAPGPHPANVVGVADYYEEYRKGDDGDWKLYARSLTPVFGRNAKPVPAE